MHTNTNKIYCFCILFIIQEIYFELLFFSQVLTQIYCTKFFSIYLYIFYFYFFWSYHQYMEAKTSFFHNDWMFEDILHAN